MKSILISIRPEWVAKILNGEKTIEIRKNAPKCELPIDVYIYCTQSKPYVAYVNGKTYTQSDGTGRGPADICFNGKVVAKFTLRKVGDLCDVNASEGFLILDRACLDYDEFLDYLYKGREAAYAWHISDLVIFDEPMELEEFEHLNPSGIVTVSQRSLRGLSKRPPQSWCYVERSDE